MCVYCMYVYVCVYVCTYVCMYVCVVPLAVHYVYIFFLQEKATLLRSPSPLGYVSCAWPRLVAQQGKLLLRNPSPNAAIQPPRSMSLCCNAYLPAPMQGHKIMVMEKHTHRLSPVGLLLRAACNQRVAIPCLRPTRRTSDARTCEEEAAMPFGGVQKLETLANCEYVLCCGYACIHVCISDI